MKASKEMVV